MPFNLIGVNGGDGGRMVKAMKLVRMIRLSRMNRQLKTLDNSWVANGAFRLVRGLFGIAVCVHWVSESSVGSTHTAVECAHTRVH